MSLGHFGPEKPEKAIIGRNWWPKLSQNILNVCKACRTCGELKSAAPAKRAPLQPMCAGFPNEIVDTDLMGPLPQTPRGKRYLLVMVDYFTKWAEAIPLGQADALSVAQTIVMQWIATHGVPLQLRSDQGPQFESRLLADLCHVLGILKTRTTPYQPQRDGEAENTTRTIKGLLTAVLQENQHCDWDIAAPLSLV